MSALQTRGAALLGCRYPIIQTGMGWVSTPQLTAATSAAGGFGILAAATLTMAELEASLDAIGEATDAPYGVNVRADREDAEARVRLLASRGVRLVSFAGPPSEALIKTLKDAGVLTMPTIGLPRHAQKVSSWGVDALIAQGGEGGGHTGAVSTSVLLPKVCAEVDIPVFGAGGFRDGRGLVAALAYGAAGVAMGTRFLLTRESPVPDVVKARYLDAGVDQTVVTRAIDGHPQRVIHTPWVAHLERSGPLSRLWMALRHGRALRRQTGDSWFGVLKEAWSRKRRRQDSLGQMLMAANAPMLTRNTMVEGDLETGILPTGQVTGAIGDLPTVAELVASIVAEAEATLDRLGGSDE